MKEFKIMYPEDHYEKDKAGKPYLPPKGKMVVMSGSGRFFLYDNDPYRRGVVPLSNVLYKYDVIWKRVTNSGGGDE